MTAGVLEIREHRATREEDLSPTSARLEKAKGPVRVGETADGGPKQRGNQQTRRRSTRANRRGRSLRGGARRNNLGLLEVHLEPDSSEPIDQGREEASHSLGGTSAKNRC